MKKVLLLTAMFFALLINANAQSGTVEVFSEDGDRFWVIINGQKQNVQPLANVKIPGIKEQWFKMRVIFDNEEIPNLDQQVQMVGVDEKWMDVTYSIKKNNKGKYVIRGSAWKESADQGKGTATNNNITQTETVVTKQEPVQTKTTTTSTPNSTTTTKTTETTNVNTNTMGVGTNVNVKEDGENVSMNVNIDLSGIDAMMNGGTNSSVKTTTTTKSTTTSSYSEEPVNTTKSTNTTTTDNTAAVPAKKSCSSAMSTADFNSAKQSIASKGFDDTRLQVANQILKSNCMNVAQVIEVMKVFGFEESKLSFAKSAYQKTVDKNNYFKINDAFSFDASIEDLNKFLESQE